MKKVTKEMIRDCFYELVHTSKNYVLIEETDHTHETKEYSIYKKSSKLYGFIQQLFKEIPRGIRVSCLKTKYKTEGKRIINDLEKSREKL